MKYQLKKLTIGLLLGATVSSMTAFAANATLTKDITYRNIEIAVDGNKITPTDANGNYVEPFIMDGTTYLPVRAVANAFDKDVSWEDATSTVSLNAKNETNESKTTAQKETVPAGTIQKDVTYRDIKIVVDGSQITPTDANGNPVEPFIMDGTTYLPVRAVANAFGKEVGWDDATSTVYLGQQPAENGSVDGIYTSSMGLNLILNTNNTGSLSDGYTTENFIWAQDSNSVTLINPNFPDDPIVLSVNGNQLSFTEDMYTLIFNKVDASLLAKQMEIVTMKTVTVDKTDAKKPIVTIEMADGSVMKAELYPNVAPISVENFISLIEKGFYDGLTFHRNIPGFVIQGGCPVGNGTGGPGYSIKGEFSSNGVENNLKHTRGVLSMARATDPDSAGSQFFIMHADAPHLDGEYAAFGKVIEGMDVVDAIANSGM